MPLLVQFLIDHPEMWPEIRQQYRQRCAEIAEGSTGVLGRLADHVAAVSVAAKLTHEALKFPWPWMDPADFLREVIEHQAENADIDVRALREVHGWICQNEHRFHGRGVGGNNEVPPQGSWVGHWDIATSWKFVGIFSHEIKSQLSKMGYDTGAVIQGWRDRGWLKVRPKGNRHDWTVRFERKDWPVIAILREAIDWLHDAEEGDAVAQIVEEARSPEPLVSCFRCHHAPDYASCKIGLNFSNQYHVCAEFQQKTGTFDQMEPM